jgi:hypothetical protein
MHAYTYDRQIMQYTVVGCTVENVIYVWPDMISGVLRMGLCAYIIR